MPKVALYSRSKRTAAPVAAARAAAAGAAPASPPPVPASAAAKTAASTPIVTRTRFPRLRNALARWQGPLWALAGALVVAGIMTAQSHWAVKPHVFTQKDIDAAVLHTLDTNVLPSAAARAVDAIRPSVVHVRGLHKIGQDEGPPVVPRANPGKARVPSRAPPGGAAKPDGPAAEGPPKADDDAPDGYRMGIGSGVVIVDSGLILTNLHVVAGSESIIVTFFDGFESVADVVSTQPENDLAVLKARKVPDDLQAATLRSTTDLNVGDEVVAVGFPFGIGPSASSGVVSGLRREFRSPEGKRQLTNLIQFDAAANPGNSGGPLVTMDGAVVGIVTGIYNPTEQRVFIGIGFAVPIENAASAVGLSPF